MHKPSECGRERGFSLVEVLCAVAIAASAIVVLTGGINGSLRGTAALDRHLGARILLQTILEDELSAESTVPDQREGESQGYKWRLVITPEAMVPALTPPHLAYRLTATVTWPSSGQMSANVLKIGQ
jgi:prepilin-type N-terminal cleavage/methylation domain-containing protein